MLFRSFPASYGGGALAIENGAKGRKDRKNELKKLFQRLFASKSQAAANHVICLDEGENNIKFSFKDVLL